MHCLIVLLCQYFFLQLIVGRGQNFCPRNGSWNFNDKVEFFLLLFFIDVIIVEPNMNFLSNIKLHIYTRN